MRLTGNRKMSAGQLSGVPGRGYDSLTSGGTTGDGMATDGPEELLVTIAPLAPVAPPPESPPWVGPLLIIGAPIGLAFLVFLLLLAG